MKLLILIIFLLYLPSTIADCSKENLKYKDQDFTIEVLSYSPNKILSQVIIVPPTGGTNLIDRSYASGLCSRGIHTYILSHWTDDDEYNLELPIHTRFYGRAFRAIGLLVKEIAPKGKIGILGTSVGGLHAAIAASHYPEITSAYIITGGAHIPSIIANSDQDVMKKAWNERRVRYRYKDKSEYIAALEKVIELEPLNRLKITPTKKFGLVIGTEDKTVPTVNQERLKSLWKPEKVIYKDHDHFWTIINSWLFDADELYGFFTNEEK